MHLARLPATLIVKTLTALSTLALVTSLLGGCARSHLFYDARELRHPALQPAQQRILAHNLADKLHGRAVTWVDPEGRTHAVTVDDAGLSKLGLAELGALWLVASTGDVGGENDVRVHVQKTPSAAVTVLTALDGSITVISSPKDAEDTADPVLSEDGIRERFGIKSALPGKWDVRERRALTDSLALLNEAELDVVRTVGFDRMGRSPDGDLSKAALYEIADCRGIIYLYSSGVSSDAFRFVGDVDAPRSAVLHAIVHEIGHAFRFGPARAKFCEARAAKGPKAVELHNEGNALMERSPLLDAYLKVLNGEPAPTDYGTTSADESFAESFALFHVDPSALKRARPAVYAWFARGGHVEAARASR